MGGAERAGGDTRPQKPEPWEELCQQLQVCRWEDGGAVLELWARGCRAYRRGREQQHQAAGGGPFLQAIGDHACQDPTCKAEGGS